MILRFSVRLHGFPSDRNDSPLAPWDCWIAPGFTGKYTKHHPIIFSHLLERLTALIIVMFGETIVGIADYFTATNFSVQSILIFTTVAALFFTYIVEFDHLINEHQRHETGNLMIYLHYFILFGLSLVTVAMKFIDDTEADQRFAVICMYFWLCLVLYWSWDC
ncbi:low temperature requirement protein A [Limosilactobacillus reuteri]|uniref:low temperature requirement protein A n=1 Tax=Limosilactobacillus reuteri TaxID=1598 RepID=UPI0032EB47B2